MSGKKILVVAPHSDDAELGVGGYLHREQAAAEHIAVIVLAGGSYTSTKSKHEVSTSVREIEGRNAAKVLGIDEYEFLWLAPDSNFNTIPRGVLVQALENAIFSREWDELFIPLPSFHSDHVVAWEACIAATRPHLGRVLPRAIYAYEYPGQSWGPRPFEYGRVYVELRPQDLAAKLASLEQHKSQWASNERSLYGARGVKALAELRGAEIGVDAAEMFYMLKARI